MKTFKLWHMDIRNGCLGKVRYLIFFAVCLFCCNIFGIFQSNLMTEFQIEGFHMADCIAYMIHGSLPGNRMAATDRFEFSAMWMILLMFQFLIPLDYPVKTMELWGYPYFMHSSRRSWWNAKCMYVLSTNVLTEIIKFSAVIMYCLVKHIPLSMQNNPLFYEIIFGDAKLNFSAAFSSGQNIMLLLVIPLLGIMAMSIVQLFLSVWIHPIIAYLGTIAWLIASVFAIHPLLIGNCTMPIRNLLIDEDGLPSIMEVSVCILSMIVFWTGGLWLVKRKDIFVMKREG
ncbi:MAG: hypothetical protein ACI4S0_01585 [Dorea sp.]